jgi:hypothetical protein
MSRQFVCGSHMKALSRPCISLREAPSAITILSSRALIRARFFRGYHNTSSPSSPSSSSSSSWWQTPRFSFTVKMSSLAGGAASAALYAVVSNPTQVGAKPEEAAAKAHHLRNGKGFTNPWDSYEDMSGPWVLMQLFW